MKLFLVLTAVLAHSAHVLIEGKIIAGHTASLGQFPYQVSVHLFKNGHQVCGGSIISDRWVLTAAHCVVGASDYKVIAGGTERFPIQPTQKTFKVIEQHVHPRFNIPEALNHDVALLKLEAPVTFNKYIQQIRLSRASDYLKPNVSLTLSGWGNTAYKYPYATIHLRYTSVTSISNKKCQTYYNYIMSDQIVCAQGRATDSPCDFIEGDGGAPLVKIDHDGKPTQVGVLSFGPGLGCESNLPSVYSRVADCLSFILQFTDVNTN